MARLTCGTDNTRDIMMRINSRADPVVMRQYPHPTCERCGRKGHTAMTCSHWNRGQDPENNIFWDMIEHDISHDEFYY